MRALLCALALACIAAPLDPAELATWGNCATDSECENGYQGDDNDL